MKKLRGACGVWGLSRLCALLALLLFGGHAIHSFVATMIFGVVLVGTYTSVFIAAPILIYLGVGTTRMEAEGPAELKPISNVPITMRMTDDTKNVYTAIGKLAGINVLFDPDYTSRRIKIVRSGWPTSCQKRRAIFVAVSIVPIWSAMPFDLSLSKPASPRSPLTITRSCYKGAGSSWVIPDISGRRGSPITARPKINSGN